MMYSNTCCYAIRAMCQLALLRPDTGYASLHEICSGTDLPASFVAKIFGDLVHAGLLTSAKGRGGGFALTRHPGQITLQDIVSVIDGVHPTTRCVVGLRQCDDAQPCPQHEQVKPIRAQIRRYLAATTLEQMSDALAKKIAMSQTPSP